MKSLFLPAAALLLAAGVARAEGPIGPPQGPEQLMDEIKKASIRVSKALKDSEEALARLARGEKADPKPVDVDLPKKTDQVPQQTPPPSPGGGG